MSKEQKTLKSCYILDRLREWFELYGNQNHQRAEEELHLAIDELYEYQQKDQRIADLEAKLAEKDEEIAYLTKQVKKFNNEAQKYFEDAYCNDFHNQDKISFAIGQLKKVKEKIQEDRESLIHYNNASEVVIAAAFLCDCKNFIDNQIEELKKEIN